MVIVLISDDRELYQLCRNILDETRSSWTLSAATAYSPGAECDFCIWDVDPQRALPAFPELSPLKHLFLVECEDLSRFRKAQQGMPANILLKPATTAVLTAFLDVAFAVPLDIARKSKAEEDAVTECFLQTSLRLQLQEQDRSNFIAGVAHDLRTPATALLGYSELLLDQRPTRLDESQRAILKRMQFSASRLSRMVSAIFELSVEGWHAASVDFRREDLRKCVDQALHEIGPFADDKDLSVQVDMAPFDSGLYFDPVLIERAIINILENACRFTPGKGTIEIRGYPFFLERRNARAITAIPAERRAAKARAPNSYRLDFRNSGEAIPPEQLEHIFGQYISRTSTSEYSGSGLGLAICKTIVTQHRGRVWAENTELGPRFSMVLPGQPPPFPSRSGRARTTSGLPFHQVNFDAAK